MYSYSKSDAENEVNLSYCCLKGQKPHIINKSKYLPLNELSRSVLSGAVWSKFKKKIWIEFLKENGIFTPEENKLREEVKKNQKLFVCLFLIETKTKIDIKNSLQ